jgi:arylformamidase
MTIVDATLTISPQMPVWPGDPPARLTVAHHDSGLQVTQLCLGAHTGTHVDAPRHLLGPEAAAIDDLSLEALCGPGVVADLSMLERLDRAGLQACLGSEPPLRLLLRLRAAPMTAANYLAFWALEVDAAQWLVERGVRLVGVDVPSVDAPESADLPVHRVLLEGGVIIVENLALSHIAPGAWQCACLPLRLAGADGAPARVALWR